MFENWEAQYVVKKLASIRKEGQSLGLILSLSDYSSFSLKILLEVYYAL